MELQMSEYLKLAQASQPFRAKYAYKMSEVIQNLENAMRVNVQNLNNSI